MSHRLSRMEKGKWPAGRFSSSRRSPVKIPEADNSEIIEAHRLTLIGRATNPYVQKTKAILDFLPQFWNLEGRITGRDLGRDTFLFRFETEEELQRVLRKGPYHYKQWMLILQKWEPIVSASFPFRITFWVNIIGIPVHHCTDITLTTIGKALGHLSGKDVDQARVRVDINGLQPLEMNMEISLPSGDLIVVDFVYEKLEKHCFTCFSLSHEKRHCPLFTSTNGNSAKPLGINQQKTLTRLEDDKRRQDSKKRSRSDYEERYASKATERGGRVSAQDMRDWIRNNSSPNRRESSHRQDTHSRGPSLAPSRDKTRVSSHQDDSSRYRAPPRESQLRCRDVSQTQQPSRHREGKETDQSYSHHGDSHPQPPRVRNPNEEQTKSIFSRLQQSTSGHTPPPRPLREPVVTPFNQEPLREGINSGERRSALERIEIQPTPAPSWTHRHNVDAQALQEVEVQYMEGNPPPMSTRLSLSSPPSSVFQRLGTTIAGPSFTSPLRLPENSPLATGPSSLPKIKIQGRAKQGKKAKVTIAGPPKQTPKRRTVRAAMRTRGAKSPLQGVNLRKTKATPIRAQPKAKKKLQIEAVTSQQGLADVPIHSTNSAEFPPATQDRGQGSGFRSPRLPLP